MRRFLVCLILCLVFPFTAFASATPSNAEIELDDSFSSLGTIVNTVDYKGVYVVLYYYDMSNERQRVFAKVSSDGSFSIKRPDNYAMPDCLVAYMESYSLPSSGKYKMTVDISMHTGLTYGDAYFWAMRLNHNANDEDIFSSSFGVRQNNGDLQVSGNVAISSNVHVLELGARLVDTVSFTISGVLRVNFTRTKDPVDVSTPGSDTVDSDIQQDISENTGQMVERQEEANGLLANIIQTISYQLTAFWNQLAGEFTNLFGKMDQQHDDSMDKLEDVKDGVTNKLEDVEGAITDKLEDVKKGIISGIIDGLKSLFIPSDKFFKAYFDDLLAWFSERLGFLAFPIDLLIDLADMFLVSSSADCVLTIPTFSVMDEKLWDDMSFNLTDFLNEHFKFVLDAIKVGTSVALVFGFVGLCERKWNEVMMN